MGQVRMLHPQEPADFDEQVLAQLWDNVGPAVAENIFCRALEDLSIRMAQIRNNFGSGDNCKLRGSARRMSPIARQIGLGSLSDTADAVVDCIDQQNHVALAATVCRLLRVGEAALSNAVVQQDLTV